MLVLTLQSISVRSVGYAAEFAMVCSPDKMEFWNWSDSNFLFRKVVHPICHLVSVIILLIVAITYFVLPPLRYIFILYNPRRIYELHMYLIVLFIHVTEIWLVIL